MSDWDARRGRTERRDQLIDFLVVASVIDFQVAVLVPLVAASALNEPHAPLGEAASHQALPAEVGGAWVVEAVQLLRRLGFAAEGLQFRREISEGE